MHAFVMEYLCLCVTIAYQTHSSRVHFAKVPHQRVFSGPCRRHHSQTDLCYTGYDLLLTFAMLGMICCLTVQCILACLHLRNVFSAS